MHKVLSTDTLGPCGTLPSSPCRAYPFELYIFISDVCVIMFLFSFTVYCVICCVRIFLFCCSRVLISLCCILTLDAYFLLMVIILFSLPIHLIPKAWNEHGVEALWIGQKIILLSCPQCLDSMLAPGFWN